MPPGKDPEPPTVLKKHLFENPDILTQSEKALPEGYGTAVIGEIQTDAITSEINKIGL